MRIGTAMYKQKDAASEAKAADASKPAEGETKEAEFEDKPRDEKK